MSELTYVVPVVGEKNTVAVPKVDSAFTEIKTVVNGKIGGVNLETNAVETEKIKEEAVTGKKLGTETLRMTEIVYGAQVERALGAEIEISATRAAFVIIEIRYNCVTGEAGLAEIVVGTQKVGEIVVNGLTGQDQMSTTGIILPQGKKFKVVNVGKVEKAFSTHILL